MKKNLRKYKLLSFQPYSLYCNGGGSRILRRLYGEKETDVCSIVIANEYQDYRGPIREKVVNAFPTTKRWMRWKLRNIAAWLRYNVFRGMSTGKILRAAKTIDFDILHIVDHGLFSTALCDHAIRKQKQIWVSFHDHFYTCSSYEQTKLLWVTADRRLVISENLGKEYMRLFGEKSYEIMTDGVLKEEISKPLKKTNDPVKIYFAGLLHVDYLPVFDTLAEALDRLAKSGCRITLVLRGAKEIPSLNNRLFTTEYRPVTLAEKILKEELDEADILYLPIKFTTPAFYKYSLSTKMVGYLGAAGTILYHGPADSALCNLLERRKAAVCCTSLNPDDVFNSIQQIFSCGLTFSMNAKELAKTRFCLEGKRRQFWQCPG